MIAVPLYITIVDGQMREPYDAYWQLGRFVLLRPEDAKGNVTSRKPLPRLAREGVLLPAHVRMAEQRHAQHAGVSTTLTRVSLVQTCSAYDVSLRSSDIFFIDLLFTTVGYAFSLRPFDTHIRCTAEPTFLG